MRIGIVGAGTMAEALGSGWARAGHELMIGARSSDRAEALAARIGGTARGGAMRQAALFGDVTLLAVPGEHAVDALAAAGAADRVFAGRPLIDCTNALAPGAFADPPGSVALVADAGAARIAEVAVDARVVKAFSICAAETWAGGAAASEERPLVVPLCTDDPDARAAVAGLVRDLGAHPVDGGGLRRAQYVEAMTVFVMGLWLGGCDARDMLPPLEASFVTDVGR